MHDLVKFLGAFAENPGLAMIVLVAAMWWRFERTMVNGNNPVARAVLELKSGIEGAASEVRRSVDEIKDTRREVVSHREMIENSYPSSEWATMVQGAKTIDKIDELTRHIAQDVGYIKDRTRT